MEGSHNPLRKRINKIFESHLITDNSEAIELVSQINITNANSRRVLINEIERRDLIINKSVFKEYSILKNKLQNIVDSLKGLNNAVNGMSKKLHESKVKTHNLITETNTLKGDIKKKEKKLLWVNTLLNTFDLPIEKTNVLLNINISAPLTADYFSRLSQIENIHENCKTLVKCWYQTSAFDIMENIGLQQEMAIEKLYHWTIGASRSIDSPNNPLIPKAVQKFQNRQVLFTNIIDEYTTSRKVTIVQLFIDALTKGNETSKPIEFNANNAKQYVSDILTWVYQVIPIEKENLNNLLSYCTITNKNELILNALTNIMEAICPLLKIRVELTLTSDKETLVLWSIFNLIRYYHDVIHMILSQGHLIDTFNSLIKKSEEVFLITLDNKIQRELSHGVKAPPSDLNPSIVVTDLVSFLRELLAASNVSGDINSSDRRIITTHILDPLLHAINETACHLSSTDMSVYMLNCIYHIQCTLSLYTCMDDYNERLQAQSEAQIDTLTSEQASYLVANLNLGPIYTILQEKSSGPLSAIPGMDTTTLKTFLNKFDMFIATPEMYMLSQLKLLISHNHKSLVKKRSVEVILAIYEQLYQSIVDPINDYTDSESIVRHTPEDVSKLLL